MAKRKVADVFLLLIFTIICLNQVNCDGEPNGDANTGTAPVGGDVPEGNETESGASGNNTEDKAKGNETGQDVSNQTSTTSTSSSSSSLKPTSVLPASSTKSTSSPDKKEVLASTESTPEKDKEGSEDEEATTQKPDEKEEEKDDVDEVDVTTDETDTEEDDTTEKANSQTPDVTVLPDISKKPDAVKQTGSDMPTVPSTKTTPSDAQESTTGDAAIVGGDGKDKEVPKQAGKAPSPEDFKARFDEPDQPSSGHFMAYFVTCIVFVVLGYLFYHNRKKVMGYIVEGRNGTRRTGGRGSNGYKQLSTNVEEALLPGMEKDPGSKNFVY